MKVKWSSLKEMYIVNMAPVLYSFPTQPSITGCVFRLRDQHGMGIIRGRLGAPPQGEQINLGEDISRQLGREGWFQNAE